MPRYGNARTRLAPRATSTPRPSAARRRLQPRSRMLLAKMANITALGNVLGYRSGCTAPSDTFLPAHVKATNTPNSPTLDTATVSKDTTVSQMEVLKD